MRFSRDYLTSLELSYIVTEMLKKETSVEREVVKIGLISQMLLEDKEEIKDCEDCNDIYDLVMSKKLDFNKIVNFNIIDKLLEAETSQGKVLSDFLDSLDKKMDKALVELPKDIKGFTLESFVQSLKEVIK